MTQPAGPGLFDALSLAAQTADELVVRSVRDTHVAVADRVERALGAVAGGAATTVGSVHRGVAAAAYAGIGVGVRAAATGLEVAGRAGWGPRLETGPGGRAVSAVVNGLIGDRIRDERPALAIPMAVRVDHADVPLDRARLTEAFPGATGRVVVLVHGWSEQEGAWSRHRERHGTTYAETLAAAGWTPVRLRVNTGLPVRENGVLLASLLQDLADAWPVELERLALVGHSMGGLIIRSACSVVTEAALPWAERVTDVVTLGTPHLGAPLAGGVGRSAAALLRLPETAALGRILDWRSLGVRDLVAGLDDAVPALPHARYRLVHATIAASADHPVSRFFGDLLVRVPSASGHGPFVTLFPDAEVLHLPRTGHLDLLNHPRVHVALLDWLA